MFDKFGEFDSVEELNRAAAAQLAEGDEEAIFAIAKENGIDKEDAEDYIDGVVDTLVTSRTAAVGKIMVESEELELQGIVVEWRDIIIEECMNNEELCAAVRKKGKALKDCMAQFIRYAFENKVQISNKIVDVTKVTHNGKEVPMQKPLYLGVPRRADVKRIMIEYYMK